MKKFIKYVTVFMLPILILAFSMEVLLRKIPNDYLYKKNYLNKHSNKVEILFLGNSHIYFGINPEFIKQNSFNASHISQTLQYDLAILKKYENNWDNLRFIIVPVDYFSLYTTLESGIEKCRVKNYNLYYGINQSSNFLNYFEIINGPFKNNLGRLKNFYLQGKSDITCNEPGWGTIYNSINNKNLIETGKAAAQRHKMPIENNPYFNENMATLKMLIEFAKTKNSTIIFITSPGYRTYVEHLDTGQLNHTINSITRLVKNNSNSKYFNFLKDESFTDKDFFDADHLNEIGAKKFTLKIDSLIKLSPPTNPDRKTSSAGIQLQSIK